jgi:hypothetical protein
MHARRSIRAHDRSGPVTNHYRSRDPQWNDIRAASAISSPALDCSISFGRHQEKLLSLRMRMAGFPSHSWKPAQKLIYEHICHSDETHRWNSHAWILQ